MRLVALDMDGTLLDSASRVLPSSVAALRAALRQGVRVCLATGKARPAAVAAMRTVGLAGAPAARVPVGAEEGEGPGRKPGALLSQRSGIVGLHWRIHAGLQRKLTGAARC